MTNVFPLDLDGNKYPRRSFFIWTVTIMLKAFFPNCDRYKCPRRSVLVWTGIHVQGVLFKFEQAYMSKAFFINLDGHKCQGAFFLNLNGHKCPRRSL